MSDERGEDQHERKDAHARIDRLERRFTDRESCVVKQLALVEQKVDTLLELVKSFVNKERMVRIEIVVYGACAILLSGVLGAIVAKVIIK